MRLRCQACGCYVKVCCYEKKAINKEIVYRVEPCKRCLTAERKWGREQERANWI